MQLKYISGIIIEVHAARFPYLNSNYFTLILYCILLTICETPQGLL